MLDVRRWVFSILFGSLALSGFAQTNSEDTNALKLLPPYGELPQTLWERYGLEIVLVASLGLLASALAIWLLIKSRPQTARHPNVEARLALESLRGRAEDGACLSHVSQIVRRYFVSAFNLSTGEPTTEEFRRAISCDQRFGIELVRALTEFLRECDERKFSHVEAKAPIGAVDRALRFITQAKARRVQPGTVAAPAASSDDTSTRRRDGGGPRAA